VGASERVDASKEVSCCLDIPAQVRSKIRSGAHSLPTSGLCPGFQQANVVILPKEFAEDFEKFCRSNSQPCPLLAVLKPGQIEVSTLAPGSDIRTDIPRYRIWRHGKFEAEVTDIKDIFTEDMVGFFLGCSFGFERALVENGIEVRNITEGKNVSMYKTNRQCVSVGPFHCPLVVSMRPIPQHQVEKVIEITAKFPAAHGPPVHTGDAAELGISDLSAVDFGDAVTIKEGEVPVFWACGVTSTLAALSAAPNLVITHAPGHMFITDLPDTAPSPVNGLHTQTHNCQ
jgi:uncharacterized protein YcsI (UPF0317 family)